MLKSLTIVGVETLAELKGTTPRALLHAVRRNPDRFPDDFMFSLINQELASLKSQTVISSSATDVAGVLSECHQKTDCSLHVLRQILPPATHGLPMSAITGTCTATLLRRRRPYFLAVAPFPDRICVIAAHWWLSEGASPRG